MSEKESLSTGPSALGIFLSVASLGAGACLGYCHGNGIPIEKENLEFALKYGPTIVRGGIGAIGGGLIGLIGGGALGASSWSHSLLEKIAKGAGGAIGGAAVGAGVGGVLGGISGAFQTLIGYGIGYGIGYITR